MSFLSQIFAGGAEGVLKGVGSLAKDLRSAITGEDPLNAEQRFELTMKLNALEEAAMSADTLLAQGQLEVNKEEAKSGSLWAGGWRPAIGWVCAAGLAYEFLLRPLVPGIAALFGHPIDPLPGLDMTELLSLLAGMLGLGSFRMLEKFKGVARP